MRLFEFAAEDPLRVKLTAVVSQLQDRVTQDGQTMSTDELLKILGNQGITIDITDLYDIAKKAPLSNIIDNVNKNEVIFKGQESTGEEDPDAMAQTRQQMAKSAMK